MEKRDASLAKLAAYGLAAGDLDKYSSRYIADRLFKQDTKAQLNAAAESGDPVTLALKCAVDLWTFVDDHPDYESADPSCAKASEAGEPAAQVFLGDLLMEAYAFAQVGEERRTGFRTSALAEYQKAAQAGSAWGQISEGRRLVEARKRSPTPSKAERLFKQAQAKGLPEADFCSADFISAARFSGPDPDASLAMVRKAADAGVQEAQSYMADQLRRVRQSGTARSWKRRRVPPTCTEGRRSLHRVPVPGGQCGARRCNRQGEDSGGSAFPSPPSPRPAFGFANLVGRRHHIQRGGRGSLPGSPLATPRTPLAELRLQFFRRAVAIRGRPATSDAQLMHRLRIARQRSPATSSQRHQSHRNFMPAPRSRLHLLDPLLHPRFQDRQGQRAAAQHRVVETGHGELVAKLLLRHRAQILDLDHADLVGRRLTRPDEVAADLRVDRGFRRRRVVHEVLHGLLFASSLSNGCRCRPRDAPRATSRC